MIMDNKNITVVGQAKNYAEAMNIMESKSPHVVLLDIRLPGVSGMEVLKDIKQKHDETKVIMLTAHYQNYYRNKCKRAGADYFFDKATEFEKVPGALIAILEAK